MGDNRVPGIGSNVSWLARRWSRFAMNVRFCLSLFKVLCLVVECIGMVCCNSNRLIEKWFVMRNEILEILPAQDEKPTAPLTS